ncbi:MAG: hypothetical protein AB7N65_09950 [Vicinamibacterales bacterium]
MNRTWEEVWRCSRPSEAEQLQQFLASAGIDAVVPAHGTIGQSETCCNHRPRRVLVLVPREQADRARAVLATESPATRG